MYKLFLRIFFLLLFSPLFLFAGVVPQEGGRLNYRIIGFSFPGKEDATGYKLQIAAGNYNDEKSFGKNIIITTASEKNKAIAEVPGFGRQYTWRVVYENRGSKQTKGGLYHFSTLMAPEVNADSTRMRITLSTVKYRNCYVFVDGNKVLYDMKGKPVWFFPKIENHNTRTIHLRDLRGTNFGTITAIANGRLFELSYNGAVLWRGPDNKKASLDTTTPDDGYHHEFTRLANGHYMAMGFEQPYWQLPAPPDSSVYKTLAGKIKVEGNSYYQKMFFSTVSEYDDKGNVAWKWSDAGYFKTSDLGNRMLSNKLFDVNDTHANAFYFDESTQTLYISYRDISRIIQVQYPGGKVLHTYGKLYQDNERDRHLNNGFFCGQHSCRASRDGYLYLFNNDVCMRGAPPTIMMLQQPAPGRDTLEKVWEFECPLDDPNETPSPGMFYYGGNVMELPDSSFFVCMGGLYGKLFIVNRDKKILWSSQPEKRDTNTGQWIKDGVMVDNKMKEGNYRANMITREQLEKIIWSDPGYN